MVEGLNGPGLLGDRLAPGVDIVGILPVIRGVLQDRVRPAVDVVGGLAVSANFLSAHPGTVVGVGDQADTVLQNLGQAGLTVIDVAPNVRTLDLPNARTGRVILIGVTPGSQQAVSQVIGIGQGLL